MIRGIPASLMLIALSFSLATGAQKQGAGTENKKGEKPRIPAFPGAEGFGATTPGGRGGKGIKVIDHCSFAWSEDETIDLWARATNITIQWCTLEESSAKKGEPWHKFGLIAGGRSNRISIHHNLFAHHIIRSPCIGSGPADFRNNVVYHFDQGFVHHNNYIGKGGFNFVGNYYKRGGRPWCEFRRGGRYYLRNNFIHGKGLVAGNPSLPGVVNKPAGVPPVKTHSPQDAYRLVLARAGCFPRDTVSKRTVKEVIASKGSYGRQAPKNLLEGLTAGKPLKDSDNDGMPDAWEKAGGNLLSASTFSLVLRSLGGVGRGAA